MLERLKAQRAALKAKLEALTETAATEQRNLTDAEDTEFSAGVVELRKLDERIEALQEAEVREARAAAHRVEVGEAGEKRTSGTRVTDPAVYVQGGGNGQSYFRDMAKASLLGDREARERLSRNAAQVAETRALSNTNTAGGAGGELAAPTWLIDEFVAYIRPGRAVADLYNQHPVPAGTSSINIPKITGGTATGLQTSQNSTVTQTDMTTGAVSTGFSTIAGKQVASRQLLDQAGVNFDQLILKDLAADYAWSLGKQVINGTGTGANNNAVVNGLVAYTPPTALQLAITTVPSVAQFWSKCAGLISSFLTTRYDRPTHWIMHPRRFYWLLAQTDSQGRPLLLPQAAGQAVNAIGTVDSTTLQPGAAGYTGLTFIGVPVVVDPNVPINQGAGTNQDEIFLIKADDLWLFESPYETAVFEQPYAESLGILFRVHGYLGTILNRVQNGSVAQITGAGLVTPSF